MKIHLKYLSLFSFIFSYTFAYTQNDCKESLYEANKLFESGDLKGCINLLEPCTKQKESHRNKNKEELIESYHLLAIAYQNMNDIENARKYIRKMLLLKPEYMKFPNIDPMDFSRLLNQYQVNPKLNLGLKVGFNASSVALKKSYSTYASPQRYMPSSGYLIGLTADYRLKPKLSLNADFLLSGIGIRHVIDSAGGWKQKYNEQQTYFIFNLGVQQHFKASNFLQVYAGLGLGFGYLYGSNVFFESVNLETGSNQQSTQNPTATRKRFQPNANATLGISIPISKGRLSLETSFAKFFRNTVNPDKRLNDLNFIFNNQYINDDISLKMMAVNLSYKFPIVWDVSLKK